ncbi:MAG: asparagine synthase-related protein [Leptolyngbyaceae bacterium]|nr:asparagine synthase-related protein [Leptolyngbyaceae bacterium]
MCGFFLLASTPSSNISLDYDRISRISSTIDPRGPDARCVYEQKGLLAIHTHLRINGYSIQPLLFSDGVAVYNGEIYNEWQRIAQDPLYSDANTLVDLLESEGIDGLPQLDGEFAICVYLPGRRMVCIITDTFGTKPVYYCARPGQIAVGSYDSTLLEYDSSVEPIRVPANTLLVIAIDSGALVRSQTAFKFDFSLQTADSYDPWIDAFSASLKKRTSCRNQQYFVPLSSGYDSGLIAATLSDWNAKFRCYTVPYLEDESILRQRIEILRTRGTFTTWMDISREDYLSMSSYMHSSLSYYRLSASDFGEENFPDPDFRNVPGYVAAALICSAARSDGYLIQLSGQGSDELLTDYSTGSMRMSELKGDWRNLAGPWKNLHAGWNSIFLGATERICGLFGIETRYPFLDRALAQTFINLSPGLKELRFKAPIATYFDRVNYPYTDRKQGFAGFNLSQIEHAG